MPRYTIAGLDIDSDAELSGVIPVTAVERHADVSIRRGRVPASLPHRNMIQRGWMMQGENILLMVPGARILIHAGHSITFEAEPGTSEADALPFVLGSALGILLQQRGCLVLHASAIRIGDGAMLFCGRSGAGKSTVAAALTQRGFPLVADDVASITIDAAGCPLVLHDNRELKLWTDAAEGLDLREQCGAQLRLRAGKYYVTPLAVADEPLPIAAIHVLRPPAADADEGVHAVDPLHAAAALRRHAYRPRLVAAMDQEAEYFTRLARVVARAPVFELRIARSWERLPANLDHLIEGWNKMPELAGTRNRSVVSGRL